MDGAYYFKDFSSNRIELYFKTVPKASIRKELKENFWKWDPDKECWYAYLTVGAEIIAKELGATDGTNYAKQNYTKMNPQQSHKDIIEFKGKIVSEKEVEEIDGPEPVAVSCFLPESQQSTGFVACLITSKGEIIQIGITNVVSAQDSSKNIFWVDRAISRKIISGIIDKKPYIIYDGKLCRIKSYLNTTFIKNIVKHSGYFLDDLEIAEIWVQTLKMPCYNHPDSVEMVTAYVPVRGSYRSYQINIYYCPVCRKYYINADDYNNFAKKYGLPLVRLRIHKNDAGHSDFINWNEESILHTMGYNVNSQDNLSDEERKNRLLHAIETRTLTKAEVLSFLEFLIHRNKGKINFANACSKWEEDANFIKNYNIDKQKKVIGHFKL